MLANGEKNLGKGDLLILGREERIAKTMPWTKWEKVIKAYYSFIAFNLHHMAIIAAIWKTFIIIRGFFSKAKQYFFPFYLRRVCVVVASSWFIDILPIVTFKQNFKLEIWFLKIPKD